VVPLTEPIRYAHLPPAGIEVLACPALYVDLDRRAVPALLTERYGSVVALSPVNRSYHGAALARYKIALLLGSCAGNRGAGGAMKAARFARSHRQSADCGAGRIGLRRSTFSDWVGHIMLLPPWFTADLT
jgi:hypothetical protein